ncbi:MAG: hypothetical protein ACYSUI_07995 [Planctomycetota bacterium]|jgi:hypothetical protein
MAQPQIHVLLEDPVVPPEIAAALRRIDAWIASCSRPPTSTPTPAW